MGYVPPPPLRPGYSKLSQEKGRFTPRPSFSRLQKLGMILFLIFIILPLGFLGKWVEYGVFQLLPDLFK